MWSTEREIAAGDVIIVWLTRDVLQPLVVSPGKELNSKFGAYRHADFIGVPYGSKVASRTGRGFVHLLRPTPELWTSALPHRTQILYLADIAFVTGWLDIRRGSKVIEAGTGSGSFSHSVARTIGEAGHLWSYEFHEARATKAREEFTRHGMADIVTLTHRNVCKEGFTVVDTVDSVFLDLPAPWEAVEHAKIALRKDRTTRICCFSPCIEQVLRTVSALNTAGFSGITMHETLLRQQDVNLVPVLQTIDDVTDKLKQSETKREHKRLRQKEASSAAAASTSSSSNKRKRGAVDEDAIAGTTTTPTEAEEEKEGGESKRPKIESRTTADDNDKTATIPAVGVVDGEETEVVVPAKMSVSRTMAEVRGHTSYLTFAYLLPVVVASSSLETDTVTVHEEGTTVITL